MNQGAIMQRDSTRLEDERGGNGLRFFAANTPPEQRRRRWIFVVISAMAGAMTLWPIYPRFARPEPLLLGLPMSLVWILFALFLAFGALVWLYRSEPHDDDV